MKNHVVELISHRFLFGVNRWSYSSVLESIIDIGSYESGPTLDIPYFNHRLMKLLPSLIEHHCSEGERGGFLHRLQQGTWLGHVLEHVVIELQRLIGMPFSFGQTRQIPQFNSRYFMVFASSHEKIALQALHEACDLVSACVYGEDFDLINSLERIKNVLIEYDGGVALSHQMRDAKRTNTPYLRRPEMQNLQLGYCSDAFKSTFFSERSCRLIGLANPINIAEFLKFAGFDNIGYGDDAWTILQSPQVDIAIIETNLEHIQSRGMVYQYPHCDVAIVRDIDCEDDIPYYRCHVDSVGSNGFVILNIDNPHVFALKDYAQAKIFYYSMQSSVEHLRDKLQNNNVLYWERNKKIYCWDNHQEYCLGKIDFLNKDSVQDLLIYLALAKTLNVSENVVFSFIKDSVLIS